MADPPIFGGNSTQHFRGPPFLDLSRSSCAYRSARGNLRQRPWETGEPLVGSPRAKSPWSLPPSRPLGSPVQGPNRIRPILSSARRLCGQVPFLPSDTSPGPEPTQQYLDGRLFHLSGLTPYFPPFPPVPTLSAHDEHPPPCLRHPVPSHTHVDEVVIGRPASTAFPCTESRAFDRLGETHISWSFPPGGIAKERKQGVFSRSHSNLGIAFQGAPLLELLSPLDHCFPFAPVPASSP